MAAPKLTNLYKKSEQGAQDKVRLQQLIKTLQEKLKDPETAKKAALIIENMFNDRS